MDEKAKILIVEDERIIALETRYKLESMGYDVSAIVSSGEEAVRKAEELHPDLVLMDIVLQGEMDGVEAAGQIRTRFDIPVVYVTANISDARLEDIMRSEPFGCLFKPLEDMELQAAVKMALHKYKMEKKLWENEERYRALFENAGEAIYVVQDDKIKFVNPKAEELYGYSQEEITSRPFTDFVHEEDRDMLLERHMRRLKGEKPTGASFRMIDKSGDTRWVELNAVEFSWEDKPAILCFHKDITERKQMEEELRKEMNFRNTLVQASPAFFVAIDADGKIIMMNESMLHTLGYTANEVVGKDYMTSLVPEKDHEMLSRVFEQLIKLHGPTLNENRVLSRDGRELLVEWHGRSIFDEHGKFEYFFGTGIDITDRKRSEKALRDSEKKYRTLAETTNDVIYAVDLNGNFTYISPAAEKITGYSLQKLLGHSFTEIIAPEYLESMVEHFKKGIAGKKFPLVEIELRHKDKGTVPVELNVTSLLDTTGKTTGRIGIARDITERKRAEEALKNSEERFRTIIEGMEDGYYEVDLTGGFTFFNQAMCTLANVPAEELMGMNDLEYTDPETAKKIYKTFNEVYRTGKSADVGDYQIIRKDGSRRTLEFNVSLMRDKAGAPVGFRGIARDVTKRKANEENLREHREHLALINQILRHDLTNDLVVMQSALNLYNKSPAEELLEEISSRTKKSIELIHRMRALESFISLHKDLKAYNIRDVINEVAGNYSFIDIKIKGKARVVADDSLFSVIDNIMRNAVIHGKADRIEATIRKKNDMFEVRIADNGSGIAAEIKETIFEEGFMHGDTGHTGLGLHIVKKAMEKYGGYVYAEDNEPRGAAFVLMFKAL